jgi:dipeptidyl aminopeptidase/acylaminoacyl peptidase
VLLRQKDDEYSKLYLLNHRSKKYKLQKDFGRNISMIETDPWYRTVYLYIDNDGDENYGIYTYDIKKKNIEPLFVNKGFKASIESYSDNPDHLFIRSNHENKKIYSIYKFNKKDKSIKRLTKGKTSWDGAVVNPKETHMALVVYKSNNESLLSILDLKSGAITLKKKRAKTVFTPSFFHPEKPILYINTDEKSDRKFCASMNYLESSRVLTAIKKSENKDLTCYYSKSSKITQVRESYSGKVEIKLFDGVFGQKLVTPLPKNAIASGFRVYPGTTQAFVMLVSSDKPGDYYTFDLSKKAKARLKPITKVNRSKIKNKDFAKSYDFEFKSYDGKNIHSIVYAKEEWLKNGEKHPVILWPHGGPDSHSSHRYRGLFQYWVLNGYVVFAPNFRGSTGFGKKFETLNDKDWGGGHIKDLIWGKRALAKESYVDANDFFIVGASFGGYSTLSAITQFPKEFKGAVAMLAISNLFTFYKSIPPDPAWQNEFLTEMGHPKKDKLLYRERSPYFHAQKIKTPLKIYQAENDTRTVKAEMDQYVDRLNKLKIPVDYVVLEKEGHGFSRKESAKKAFEGTIDFLNSLESEEVKASK